MPGAEAGRKHIGGGNWFLSAGSCTDHTALTFPRVWVGYVLAEGGVAFPFLPQAPLCTHLELLAADAAG